MYCTEYLIFTSVPQGSKHVRSVLSPGNVIHDGAAAQARKQIRGLKLKRGRHPGNPWFVGVEL